MNIPDSHLYTPGVQPRERRPPALYQNQHLAAYGWNELFAATTPQGWLMTPQTPFRPHALWVWQPHESAVLESLRINDREWLTEPVSLRRFIAPCRLTTFWDDVFPGRDAPRAYGPVKLPFAIAELLKPTIEGLPTLSLVDQLFLRLRGSVRALAMVGPALELSEEPRALSTRAEG